MNMTNQTSIKNKNIKNYTAFV